MKKIIQSLCRGLISLSIFALTGCAIPPMHFPAADNQQNAPEYPTEGSIKTPKYVKLHPNVEQHSVAVANIKS